MKRNWPNLNPVQRIPGGKVQTHYFNRILEHDDTGVFTRSRAEQAPKLRNLGIGRIWHPQVVNEQIDQVTANDKKCPANIIRLVQMRCRRFVKRTAAMQSCLKNPS